jgi:2-C-methyl-D-erythritol 4-phosphate cytidylyltransferase/2-C-methyl-D-erythritol 2,4-cyclodiphosphate synthase
VARIAAAGWVPASADVGVAVARPALAPRRAVMAERMAALLGIGTEAVSIKGTTSDGLGFAGTEGIAAWAVAAVARHAP